MKLAKLEQLIEKAKSEEGGYPCVYSHYGCSIRHGGPCSDELWHQQCSDESDEEYEERVGGE